MTLVEATCILYSPSAHEFITTKMVVGITLNQYCQINNSKLKFNNIELSAVIYLMVTENHDNLSSANNFAFKAVLF